MNLSFHWQNFTNWIKDNLKITIISLVIFSLALATRLIYLEQIPVVFSQDQLNYLINSLSISLTGKGKSGEWSPESLTPVEPTFSELPAVLLTPVFALPFSWTVNARLPFVIISLTIPIFIALIVHSITKSKGAAYFSWILALFNPWFWQNARMTFDIPISLWFYLLGITLFLRTKKFYKLYSFIPFVIGFYCYQGFKLTLPFIVITLVIYDILQHKNFKIRQPLWWKKQLPNLLLIVATAVLTSFYLFFQLFTQQDSQNKLSGQLLTPNSAIVAQAVNNDRRLALATPLNSIFINKYLQTAKEIAGRYMLVFGWRELFFEISAASSSFAVWNHGMFYLIDAVLIFIGLHQLIRQKKYLTLYLIGSMLLIGALPSTLNQSIWLFFRSALIFPFLLILAGLGTWQLWQKTKKGFTVMAFVYSLSIIYFAFLYFVRYPVYGSENIFFSPRLLGEYLQRVDKNQQIFIFEKERDFTFTNYIFYNQLFTQDSASTI